jgi:Ca2+-binding RTX toxin-like protein
MSIITGDSGANSLNGAATADTISGLAGKDTVYGGAGNDTLSGGSDDDTLQGGEGTDTYLFNHGDGNDTIYNLQTTAVADKIVFGAGITAAQISLTRIGNDLLISFSNYLADSIRLKNQFLNSNTYLNTLQFSDASSSSIDLTNTAITCYQVGRVEDEYTTDADGYVILTGRIDGYASNDDIVGTNKADNIYGKGGNDTLDGAAGDDFLMTDAGDDSLIGGSGTDFLYSGAGNDVLIGGVGDDYLNGGNGTDRYLFNVGDGQDRINNLHDLSTADDDRIVLGAGFTAENIKLSLLTGSNSGGNVDLIITFSNSQNDSLRVLNQFMTDGSFHAGNGIHTLQFADGSTLALDSSTGLLYDAPDFSAKTLTGSEANDRLTGKRGNDSIIDDMGRDSLEGGAGSDTLVGGYDNDTLWGGVGDDYLMGGVGADIYRYNIGDGQDTIDNFQVTSDADLIVFGSGITLANLRVSHDGDDMLITFSNSPNDSILIPKQFYDPRNLLDTVKFSDGSTASIDPSGWTGVISTSVTGGSGSDLLQGKDYDNNLLQGNDGQDTLYGGSGFDTLDGGSVVDLMDGGMGSDLYVVDNIYDVVRETSNADTYFKFTDSVHASISYTLTANIENLTLAGTAALNGTGNDLSNLLTGNTGANILSGGAGDDILDGSAGADTLIGGVGYDRYIVDNVGDVVLEDADAGIDDVQSSVSYTLSANVENLTLTGTAALNGTGNALANILTGNNANNVLNGGTGADSLIGGLGNDVYVVDDAGDVVTEAANAGTDTVQSAVTYALAANLENLTLIRTSAINGIGNSLNNVITGNSANNILNGGGGADSLLGGLGDDSYIIDNIGDVVTEAATAGTDTVVSALSYTLGVNLENLTLTGTAALSGTGNTLANVLIGNSAANTLTGDLGNDTLNGGAGADTLIGGLGNDTYVIDNVGDVVTEAANAGTDTIQSAVTYTLAANLENLTLIGSGVTNGTGNSLANVLTGNSANNTLTGGAGNDVYNIGRSSGRDSLVDTDTTAGNNDRLLFAGDVSYTQLWFKHVGNDLQIDIIGTTSGATIKGWYQSSANHIETLKSGDGKTLIDGHVHSLVNAMAGLTEPGAGQTTLTSAQSTTLAPVFAASWT